MTLVPRIKYKQPKVTLIQKFWDLFRINLVKDLCVYQGYNRLFFCFNRFTSEPHPTKKNPRSAWSFSNTIIISIS